MRLERLPNVEEAYYRHISRDLAPTCAEGSRDDILGTIRTWLIDDSPNRPPIFWLKGIAGTGKSTIAQTVCENAAKTKHLGATFFFSHQEKKRHLANAVFPTLISQILDNAECSKDIKTQIILSLEKNPNVGKEVIKAQFQALILDPLSGLNHSTPLLLVLDALDECQREGLEQILHLFESHIHQLPSFLRIFATSRPEGHVADILLPMLQDQDNPQVRIHEIDPSEDEDSIRVYLEHALSEAEIKRAFPMLGHWKMDKSKMEILVKKSEGLYIVASTMVKHIMHKGMANPALQIDTLIKGLQTKKHTHSAIYHLYEQILVAKYPDEDYPEILARFRRVVGSIIVLFEPLAADSLGTLLEEDYSESVPAALSQLQSVISMTDADGLIRSQHPSFPEFLTDKKSCPPRFHIDREQQHAMLADQCFNIMSALFNDPRKISAIKITPAMIYAICFWDDHLCASSSQAHPKLLERLRVFTKSYFTKWIDALYHAGRILHAIPSVQYSHSWVVSGLFSFRLAISKILGFPS